MCLTEILQQANDFRSRVSFLKRVAPIYPKLHIEEIGKEVFITTMVEFIYNGIKFKRHHVEMGVVWNEPKEKLIESITRRINESANMSINHAIPTSHDDIVGVAQASVARDDDSSNNA